MRLEESLASRPRPNLAQQSSNKPINLLEPGIGQPYFRVPSDHAAFLAGREKMLIVPLDDGRRRFFERWLRATYREEARAAKTGGSHPPSHVAGWPAVHLTNRDELATLFRFPVELVFRAGGRAWKTPTWEDRRARRVPEPPDELTLHNAAEGEESPFAVDLQLLSQTLGVHEETLDGLSARWAEHPTTPKKMILDVLALLDPETTGSVDESAAGLFSAVVKAASKRAPNTAKVYPTAIVQDGALSQTTFHLQRELAELIRAATPAKGALLAYLSGRAAELGERELRGRFRPRALTESQRAAAEHALGSTLSAVCGPPGTGKTELILNLAAHAIVERAESMAKLGFTGEELFVVASTNNRAVDNAVDPLGRELPADRLPLALRCGSQEVTASVTRDQLARALTWLEAQQEEAPFAALKAALDAYRIAKKAWSASSRPERSKKKLRNRLVSLRETLEGFGPSAPASEGAALDPALIAALEKIESELTTLLDLLDEKEKGLLKRVERAYQHFAEEHLERVKPHELASRIAALLPPKTPSIDAWSESIEAALVHLEEALSPINAARHAERMKEERARTEAEIAEAEAELEALEAAPVEDPIAAHARREERAHTLFLAAQNVREKWAIQNRATLTTALKKTIDAATDIRSLRRLFEKDRGTRAQIFALYPIIGCTLLSLGNVFPDHAHTIARLVIDEAGQCHPAYAISGLLRAKRALVIGDVNQLAPVIQLSELDETRAKRTAKMTLEDAQLEPFRVYDKSPASAQSLADRADRERRTLIDHFRCQPEIIAVSDALCGYGLKVHTPRRSYVDRVPWLSAPLLGLDLRGAQTPARGSWANREEAERVVLMVRDLLAQGVSAEAIAVLTPYVGQLELLRTLFRPHRLDDVLALGTVHRFQGGERDIALFTPAITEPRSLPFLNERPNLLNVAISRARDHFVWVGCAPVLERGRLTKMLVERSATLI